MKAETFVKSLAVLFVSKLILKVTLSWKQDKQNLSRNFKNCGKNIAAMRSPRIVYFMISVCNENWLCQKGIIFDFVLIPINWVKPAQLPDPIFLTLALMIGALRLK